MIKRPDNCTIIGLFRYFLQIQLILDYFSYSRHRFDLAFYFSRRRFRHSPEFKSLFITFFTDFNQLIQTVTVPEKKTIDSRFIYQGTLSHEFVNCPNRGARLHILDIYFVLRPQNHLHLLHHLLHLH